MSPRKAGGHLLGPTDGGEWATWRRNRDKKIANPPRTSTCKDLTQGPPIPPVKREGLDTTAQWSQDPRTWPAQEPNDE